ncbi:MAG: RodZ domain-containing protein, partial [Candidatus Sulfotelmatobacter sp.]
TEPAKSGTTASAVSPSPLPAAAPPAPSHRPAKVVVPPPFRVGISAVENCSISITADGELVARETLIAPANTSVRASHEIIVQVSNPAAISFRWNDRSVAPLGAEAQGAKTFVFDNKGLRNGQ